jgi:dTDP-4-amino-4,6-dideoxygalactose transaminase
VSSDGSEIKVRLARPDLGPEEAEAIAEVLKTGILTNGEQTRRFEEEFAQRHGVPHAVAFANGTVALAAMMLALDIGPGDEVIVPSMTFISTATSVLHVGATPVFADICPDTFNLDPDAAEAAITRRTKAIMPVHYAGQPADMHAFAAIGQRHGMLVLEDAAQAHGATFDRRPAGSWGTAGMFSFTPTKNITTGEGGLVTTSDPAIADRMCLLRNHGQTQLYRHEALGYNWRLTEMQAAMGRVQLAKLDSILERKRKNVAWMNQRLADVDGVSTPVVHPLADPVHMIYTVLISHDRDRILRQMLAAGIEVRVYFPPAHRQPIFDQEQQSLPTTDRIASEMLSLPMHSRLTPAELGFIADTLEHATKTAGAN